MTIDECKAYIAGIRELENKGMYSPMIEPLVVDLVSRFWKGWLSDRVSFERLHRLLDNPVLENADWGNASAIRDQLLLDFSMDAWRLRERRIIFGINVWSEESLTTDAVSTMEACLRDMLEDHPA